MDYGKRGDLYIRFRQVGRPIGDPSGDCASVFFYDDGGRMPVAVETLDLDALMKD